MPEQAKLILDHGGLRLLALAMLADEPRGRDEVRANLEWAAARAHCLAPSIDRTIEMLERLDYVSPAGDPAMLAPTPDGLAMLATHQPIVKALLASLEGGPDNPLGRERRLPFVPGRLAPA